MALTPSDEVAAAVRDFVQRIDAFDSSPAADAVEIRVGDQVLPLRAAVAKALVEALRAYQDPRDRGTCDHCGGPRLDLNFLLAGCGQPNAGFGRLLREMAPRDQRPPRGI